MRIPRGMLPHTVTVEAYEGESSYGQPVYAEPVQVRCLHVGKRSLVRDKDGSEVLSQAQVICDPKPRWPIGSRVTHEGDARTVISTLVVEHPSAPSNQTLYLT